ncbi:hypothetical protein LSTR_LSTR012427 [Laodelphax striatellus]|uniref:lysozyme n=1 Tax=Laodelphax striatellus TaxID=195883 RepID=A0A482WEL8_LAOST|nr:hypothetical protein LSTR_LSTR012427 [Laodelphax striatellus]
MRIQQWLVSLSLIAAVQCQWAYDVARLEAQTSNANLTKKPFTDGCLDCICETIDCTMINTCKGDHCGPFSITRVFWKDAGYPTVLFDDKHSDGAYERCANDLDCARQTVKSYMDTHPFDCNNDTVVDCSDYGAIHFGGIYKCRSPLSPVIGAKFFSCIKKM